MTCQKAQGFLGQAGTTVTETVNATKVRFGPKDALKLLDGIDTLIAAKGKKLDVFDLKGDRPDDEVLLAACRLFTGKVGPEPFGVRRLVKEGYVARAAAEMVLPSGYDPPGDRRVRNAEARLVAAGRLREHDSGVTVASAGEPFEALDEVQS